MFAATSVRATHHSLDSRAHTHARARGAYHRLPSAGLSLAAYDSKEPDENCKHFGQSVGRPNFSEEQGVAARVDVMTDGTG